jgi:hypothetical protein
LTKINARFAVGSKADAPTAKEHIMSQPLLQTPVLVFAAMMGAFIITLAPVALFDLIRSRRSGD